MNRKVQIVRWWLLAIAAVAWAILCHDPTLAIVPVAFFAGQAACFCCAGTSDCPTLCTSSPSSITIVIDGMANDNCSNCGDYNSTVVINHSINCSGLRGFPNISAPSPCGATISPNSSLQWDYLTNGGDTDIRVFLSIPCVNFTSSLFEDFTWVDNLGASPLVCTGLSSHDVTFAARLSLCASTLCDGAASTCTITTTP